MARVLVAASNIHFPFDAWRHGASFLLRHSAELDGSGEHSLTDNPEEADPHHSSRYMSSKMNPLPQYGKILLVNGSRVSWQR
jgi:hypothetical protein